MIFVLKKNIQVCLDVEKILYSHCSKLVQDDAKFFVPAVLLSFILEQILLPGNTENMEIS